MNFPTLVTALSKSGSAIVSEMSGPEAHLLHMAVGISEESGEILGNVKKHVIYHKPIDRAAVVEELGDLEFFAEGLRQGLNITREEVINGVMAKLTMRYGAKYSDASANARADKV